ncbi:MAG: branched-chain amino acid transaminase [Crocinitomicaceae bacterium]|jgi:branched-chain amino acid aminotransferase
MYFNNDTIIFLDGQYVKAADAGVNLYNQTMHYGNGVFEGIRSYETEQGTKIFKAKEHYDRLHYSAEKMHIKLNYTVEELEQISYEVLKRNNLTDAYLRPLVYLGPNMSLQPVEEVHVVIMAWEWGKYLGDKMLRLGLSSFQRPNPKSCHVEAKVVGHYTNSILATTEAKHNGYDEALLTDMNGYIAEGPGANFFMEKDGKLFTAPLGNILAGITRATVIELAQKLNIPMEEKFFTPEDIKTADAAFFCGTAAEVIGIESLDDYTFPLNWKDSKGAIIQRNYMNLVLHKELELA